jgi:serine phosphatase RsbU (regulator of sigma subunit)
LKDMEDFKHCRVLLVDDAKDNINVLVQALKNEYQLGFALNGEAALSYAQKNKPDIILLDIMMPGLDGYEVCRRLKSDRRTSGIPVIFLSAKDEVKSKADGFDAGAVDYITKPFEIVEVKARVKTHLALKLARQELESQRDRMQLSLDLAMEVQQNLLPLTAPVIDGLDLAGRSIYCDETGGDYYDFIKMDPTRTHEVGLVVGDVSDHGIPSALLMTTARAFLRQRSSMAGGLADIITDVNRQFYRDVKETGQFMTLFFGRLDPVNMRMTWVRAGHDPALLYDPGTELFEELEGNGLPLGVEKNYRFEQNRRDLAKGQTLLIGTDGIWEARDRTGRMFGKERLRQVVRQNVDSPAGDIADAVISAVDDFLDGRARQDDITLLVAKLI